MRLRWSRRALFGLLLAAALLLTFPLRLAAGWFGMDDAGISARETRGSIWRGRLSEARVVGLSIGDVQARLAVLPLLTGRAKMRLDRDGGANDQLEGAISVSRDGAGIDHVTAHVPVGATFAPLPLLALDLSDVSARFRDGTCESAEGRIRAEIDGAAIGLPLAGGLSGNARCDSGTLLVPLVSQSGMERLTLRFSAGRRYQADVFVKPGQAGTQGLLASGLAPHGDGHGLSINGAF